MDKAQRAGGGVDTAAEPLDADAVAAMLEVNAPQQIPADRLSISAAETNLRKAASRNLAGKQSTLPHPLNFATHK